MQRESISSNREVVDSTEMFGFASKLLSGVQASNLLIRSREALFLVSSFLLLRRVLKKLSIEDFSQATKLLTLRLLHTTVPITMWTLQKLPSKLQVLWLSKRQRSRQ